MIPKILEIPVISLLICILTDSVIIIGKGIVCKKDIKPVLLYSLNLVLSIFIFIVFIGRAEFTALCVGGIFAIYGGVCIRRFAKDYENRDTLLQSLDEFKAKKDCWQEDCRTIMWYKDRIGYMRHDIANHIALLEKVSPESNEEVRKLSELKDNMQKTEEIKYCANRVLDIGLEMKIKQLERRGLMVETDVRLLHIENLHCENLCLLIWLLIDNIGNLLVQNEKVVIKIKNNIMEGGNTFVSYSIKGCSERLKKRNVRRGMEMNRITWLLGEMNGSIIIEEQENGIVEAGMVEVKDIYD